MQRKRPFKRKKDKANKCKHERWAWVTKPHFQDRTGLGAVRCKDCDEWAWYSAEIKWWDQEHAHDE